MDKKQIRKRRMIIAIIVALVICVLGVISLKLDFLTADIRDSKDSETMDGYVFNGVSWQRPNLCEPDWETDIFTLERYLELNRYLMYTKHGVSETIVDIDSYYYDDTVHMMYEYFDALMHGDAEKLNSFYTEDYFKENPKYEKFTMQKIYDMEMEYITERDETINGIPCTVYVYKVGYKILENDGTFRADIQQDNAKIPLFYELVDTGSSVKISSVSGKYIP